MKKISFFILFVVISVSLCACGEISAINPLDGFKVTSVSGVEVKDDSVTLTQSQYDALVASPEENCKYTLSDGVEAKISIDGNQLVFNLTASDGNTGKYTITITVVPDKEAINPLDGFKVTSVAGVEVKDDSVTLTQSQYDALVASPEANCKYTLSDGVEAKISIDGNQLVFNLTASDGNTGKYTITITVVPDKEAINPLDGFKLTSVSGVEVKDDSVTLTQSQYDALVSSPEANCKYTLSDGVEAKISIDGNQLVFNLTASDGNTGKYTITMTVLSNLADIDVKRVCNKQVTDGKVTFGESEYAEFLNLQDYAAACEYVSSDGSTVQIAFDKQDHTLTFTVLSEDETNTNEVTVEITVALPFGTHSLTGGGNKNCTAYDYDKLLYSLKGSATVTDGKGVNLNGSYAFSAQIYPQSLAQGSEVVLSAVYADNYQIRLGLRGVDESNYLIFSDYKDRSTFLNYKAHIASTPYDAERGVNMGVIVVDGSMVMTVDGTVVYRRTLPGLAGTEMFLNTYECVALMKNLQIVSDKAQAKAAYENALVGYKEKLTGISLINSSENISRFVENYDGSVYVEGKNSSKRVMAALYQNGVPVAGYEYAVSGHLNITDTKASGGMASKVELQIAQSTQNFLKIHLFRYAASDKPNNSIYAYPTVNGKALTQVICENNTLPSGTTYEADYLFTYSGQEIKLYFKDGVNFPEYKPVYSLEANWGYTMFTFAMMRYCNVTFSDFKTYYGDDYDVLVNSIENTAKEVKFSSAKDTFTDGGCIENGTTGTYCKAESEYDKAFAFKNDAAVSGEYWLVSGRMSFGEYAAWTQGELSAYKDETHAVRYVFEYTGSAYQVFHEIKNGTDNWTGYTLIVRPQTKNPAAINFTLVNYGGKVSLLIDGYVHHTAEFEFLKSAAATVGGKGGSVILKNLTANTNRQEVEDFATNMKVYTYVSPYESRINKLAEQYKSAEKGGVLIMGSSTMDYWEDWQTDIGGRLGYNVGIGGTIVEDWLYAYDKLVKPFNPSIILVYLGGNNINNMGHTGAYAEKLMEQLLNKMHTDFPAAKIYYIYSMAVPSCYKGGKFNYEYGRFIEEMKTLVASTDWLNGIDTFGDLTQDGEAKKDLYRSDGIHLNAAGYDEFARIINAAVFNK